MPDNNFLAGAMLSLLEFSWLSRLIIGALVGAIIGGSAAIFLPQMWSKGSSAHNSSEVAPGGQNRMGKIDGNQGIVTQGQIGNNKISK